MIVGMAEASKCAHDAKMAAEPGQEDELILEAVAAGKRGAVQRLLVHRGLSFADARALLGWLPMPCAAGTTAEVEQLEALLRNAGAAVSRRGRAGPTRRCGLHESLAA